MRFENLLFLIYKKKMRHRSYSYPLFQHDREDGEIVTAPMGGAGSATAIITPVVGFEPIVGGRGRLTKVKISQQQVMKKQSLYQSKKQIARQYQNMKKMHKLSPDHFLNPVYKDPSNNFFLMPYLENYRTLLYIFERKIALSAMQRLEISSMIFFTVKMMHENGYVHGDIKPENIMIWINPRNQSVSLKFIDLESIMTKNTVHWTGTPIYFPPEMLTRLIVSSKDEVCLLPGAKPFTWSDYKGYDLWSIGIIIYMFTYEEYDLPSFVQNTPQEAISYYRQLLISQATDLEPFEKANKRLSEGGFPLLLSFNPKDRCDGAAGDTGDDTDYGGDTDMLDDDTAYGGGGAAGGGGGGGGA